MSNKHYFSHHLTKLLIALIFIVPFLPSFSPNSILIIGSYYLHELSAVTLAIALIATLSFIAIKPQMELGGLEIFLLLFILFLIIQLPVLANYTSNSLETIAILSISIFLLISIKNSNLTQDNLIKVIATSILVSVYLQIIICLLQLSGLSLTLSEKLYSVDYLTYLPASLNLLAMPGDRLSGSIGQPNNYADFMTWGIFANIFWLNTTKNNFLKCMLWINSFLFTFFISLSLSRTTIVYSFFMMLYGIFLLRRHQAKPASHLLINGLILFSSLMLCGKGFYQFTIKNTHHPTLTAMTNSSSRVNSNTRLNITLAKLTQQHKMIKSDQERIILWQQGWRMFTNKPLLGVGWNYYGANFLNQYSPQAMLKVPQFTLPMNAHNIFIHFLATCGILGSSLLIIAIIYIFYKIGLLEISHQILVFGIFMTIMIHSQVEYPLFYVQFFICLIIILSTLKDRLVTFSVTKKQIIEAKLLIRAFCIASIIQIDIALNNFLILAQVKTPPNYSNIFPVHNLINEYRLSYHPLWAYYVDINLAAKVNFSQLNSQNQQLFNLLYLSLHRVVAYSPFPVLQLKLAIMEQLLGHEQIAQRLIAAIMANYPDFISQLSDYAQQFSIGNPQLKSNILSYIDENAKNAKNTVTLK